MTPTVLVLGATGTTGSRVARALRERGVLPRKASRTDPGMTHFDWHDPATWQPAVDGVQRLYLVSPTDGSDPAPIVARFLADAADTGLQRVVLLSSSALAPTSDGPGALPDIIRAAVPEWAILRPSWFMSNMLGDTPLAAGLRAGKVVTAAGGGRVAFIDPDDIAAVAAQAPLAEPPINAELVLTGPTTHSYDELCELVAVQRGHAVRHRSLSAQELQRPPRPSRHTRRLRPTARQPGRADQPRQRRPRHGHRPAGDRATCRNHSGLHRPTRHRASQLALRAGHWCPVQKRLFTDEGVVPAGAEVGASVAG